MYSMLFVMFSRFCFFFKQKTAYEMRISDWSSDVCSSDLAQTLLSDGDLDRAAGDEVHAVASVAEAEHKGVGPENALLQALGHPLQLGVVEILEDGKAA